MTATKHIDHRIVFDLATSYVGYMSRGFEVRAFQFEETRGENDIYLLVLEDEDSNLWGAEYEVARDSRDVVAPFQYELGDITFRLLPTDPTDNTD